MSFSERVSPLSIIDRDGRSPSSLLSEKFPWNSDSSRSEALKAGNGSNSAVALGDRTAFRMFLGLFVHKELSLEMILQFFFRTQ